VPGVGSVVETQRVTTSTTYYQYLHMDHQGSVAKITDASQATQISYLNDAFGRQIIAPAGTSPNVPNELIFQSNWMTVTVGTKRYGLSPTRVLDFETGRFVSRDPLPHLVKILTSAYGNTLSLFARTSLASTIIRQVYSLLRNRNRGNLYSTFTVNLIDPTGLEDFPVDCGTATITTNGGNISWSFTRDPAKECCCKETGWINHTSREGFDPPWGFDNAAVKPEQVEGGGGGLGAGSDPFQPNQPVQRPPGTTGAGQDRWRENPWSAGPDDHPSNPQPHDSGSDRPTKPAAGENPFPFILQLVCQDDGKVLFSYRSSIDSGGQINGHQGVNP